MISCDNKSKRLTCHDLYRLYPKRVGVNLANGVDGMSGSVEALEPVNPISVEYNGHHERIHQNIIELAGLEPLLN